MMLLLLSASLAVCSAFVPFRIDYIFHKKISEIILPENVFENQENQRIVFTEPTTGINVCLIGTMHYNPRSIELARSSVVELGQKKNLYSVIVESCESRWKKTKENQPQGSIMKKLFENEMRSAADAADSFKRPVILGDQEFQETTKRMKEVFVESVKDILSPLNGGWKRIYTDTLQLTKAVIIPKGTQNFGPNDIFDFDLMAKAPIAILRYTSAFVLKAPKIGIPAFALFLYSVLQSSADDMSLSEAAAQVLIDNPIEIVYDTVLTAGINILQVALLGRVFLQALLLERNEILAESILNQCKAAKLSTEGSTVVAVLGMAHCNGVKDILLAPKKTV